MAALRRRGLACRAADPPEIWVCCPFCERRGTTPDLRFRLGVNVVSGLGHCFNCGWRSRAALKALRIGHIRMIETMTAKPVVRRPRPKLPDDYQELALIDKDVWGHWERVAMDYLHGRGIHMGQIRRHRIGLSLTGPHHHRIIFPIRINEKLVGFSARTITEATPKWLHSKGLAAPFVVRESERGVIVVEGIMDALAVDRVVRRWSEPPGVIALLGTRMTETRHRIIRKADKVILWMDPDTAGDTAMMTIGARLFDAGHTVVVIESETDPGDMDRDAIESILTVERPWGPYLFVRRLKGL